MRRPLRVVVRPQQLGDLAPRDRPAAPRDEQPSPGCGPVASATRRTAPGAPPRGPRSPPAPRTWSGAVRSSPGSGPVSATLTPSWASLVAASRAVARSRLNVKPAEEHEHPVGRGRSARLRPERVRLPEGGAGACRVPARRRDELERLRDGRRGSAGGGRGRGPAPRPPPRRRAPAAGQRQPAADDLDLGAHVGRRDPVRLVDERRRRPELGAAPPSGAVSSEQPGVTAQGEASSSRVCSRSRARSTASSRAIRACSRRPRTRATQPITRIADDARATPARRQVSRAALGVERRPRRSGRPGAAPRRGSTAPR